MKVRAAQGISGVNERTFLVRTLLGYCNAEVGESFAAVS